MKSKKNKEYCAKWQAWFLLCMFLGYLGAGCNSKKENAADSGKTKPGKKCVPTLQEASIAAAHGDIGIVRSWIRNVSEEDVAYKGGRLMRSAAAEGRLEIVKLLCDSGVNVNNSNDKGYTPLILACEKSGNVDVIEYLIRNKAHLYARISYGGFGFFNDGHTAAHMAAMSGVSDAIKILRKHKYDFSLTTRRGSTPLDIALYGARFGVVKLLYDPAKRNVCEDIHGALVIGSRHEFKRKKMKEMLVYLLAFDFDVNQMVSNGTILHYAVLFGDPEIVQIIVDRGANLNIRALLGGETALEQAKSYRDNGIVKILEKAKAANARDKK
ncbi:MAG: ankyrin repeat domain-containing protein [Phycisphaerae bacterium]|nr:ankyrin repeat domain-containing protein [Phycisphaerae bacterium]